MIERKTWKEFRASSLLWWVNRSLHLLGWAIVFDLNSTGKIVEVYPARVKFRGFGEKQETEGFKGISKYLLNNIKELKEEADE